MLLNAKYTYDFGNSAKGIDFQVSRISPKRGHFCRDRMAPNCTIRHPVLCQNSAL